MRRSDRDGQIVLSRLDVVGQHYLNECFFINPIGNRGLVNTSEKLFKT